ASFSYDEKSKLSSIKLEQNQVDKKKNIGVFKFPLDIMWETDNTNFERQRFEITEKEQTLYFKSTSKPKQIRIDPDFKLLCSLEFNPGTEMLEQQLKTGDVIAKIRAAKELTKKGKKKELDTVATAYKNETFWGTRIQFAKLLSKSPSLYGIRLLAGLLEKETDALVLGSFISNFVNIREDFVFDTMKKFLQRPTLYPYAAGAALKVIGTMRTEEAYQFLVNYSIPEDPKNIVRSYLYQAIGEIRSKEAIQFLREKLPYGEFPQNVRVAIIMGFVSSLAWVTKSERKKNLESLFDTIPGESNELVLLAIARALTTLQDPIGIGALNLIKSKLAKQEHPYIDRMIKKVKKASSTNEQVKNLKKELDSMKKSMKELKESVENLEVKVEHESKTSSEK
ncbi:MAG: HEAT repeat domain-containing protein, partial [Promethearchaeota archaeon]